MRKLIAAIALIGLALPVGAANCATANVTWEGTTPYTVDRVEADGIRYDFVGTFVQWTTTDEETLSTTNYDLDLASEAIPSDAETVTVCADGVSFTTGERVEKEPVPEIQDVTADDYFEHQLRNLAHGGAYPI